MEVQKERLDGVYDIIKFTKDNQILSIYFGGNGDLYWDIVNLKDPDSNQEIFLIDEENYEIYHLFDTLLKKIEECQVYEIDPLSLELCESSKEVEEIERKVAKSNEDVKTFSKYQSLYDGFAVEWHSDDEIYEEANTLVIVRDEESESIFIEITKHSEKSDDLSIRISNSGSRYMPFNILFMKHYNALCNMDFNYHQVHINELLYQKELKKIY